MSLAIGISPSDIILQPRLIKNNIVGWAIPLVKEISSNEGEGLSEGKCRVFILLKLGSFWIIGNRGLKIVSVSFDACR
jgi:hypothetical protein